MGLQFAAALGAETFALSHSDSYVFHTQSLTSRIHLENSYPPTPIILN